MVPNDVWYQVYKPAGVLNPDGSPNYQLVGQHTDIQAATIEAAPIPGAAIVMLCCLFLNPRTFSQEAPGAVQQLAS